MAGDEIEADLHAAGVGFGKEADEIGVGAVAGIDVVKIGDVVAGVAHGRDETRVEPDGVAAERFDVVEFLDDAGKVADAVSVGIEEALRIEFVENGGGEPTGAGGGLFEF